MRGVVTYRIVGSLALLLWSGIFARGAEPLTQADKPYPGEVALDAEGEKGLLFRRFPSGQRLYVYDLDGHDKSTCNLGCDGPRPPVYVSCDAKPMADWSVIHRYDGLCQWSYQGHPLYTFFHEEPNDPKGDGEGGVWHLLGYIKP